jgi:hypothetical protein
VNPKTPCFIYRGRIECWISVLLILCAAVVRAADTPAPVGVIFDTDMGADCDDVGALFVLHGAVERGEARLLATLGCVSSKAIAPCLDGINTWFGRPGIPVGTLKDVGFLDGSSFTAELAKRFRHRHATSKNYPDALVVYRQVLEAQPDGSVVIEHRAYFTDSDYQEVRL